MWIDEIPDILRRIKNIAEALGTGKRYLRRDRQKYNARMCIYASEAIKAGSKLTNKNISFALPYVGIGVEEVDNILGRKASQNIPQGEPIQNKHLM
jgi:sialic acid synthase SpsE